MQSAQVCAGEVGERRSFSFSCLSLTQIRLLIWHSKQSGLCPGWFLKCFWQGSFCWWKQLPWLSLLLPKPPAQFFLSLSWI